MAKIIGIADTSFKPKDSDTIIEGKTIYTSEPINPIRGVGVSTDKFFLSKAKLAELDFTINLNQNVEPLFNRWGKIGTLRLLSDELLDLD